MNDALGGHVPLSIASVAVLAAHLTAGTLRPLAQTGAQRATTLPQVPTVAESGFAGFEAEAWWGVFAPARTPGPIVARFQQALSAAFREPATAKQLTETQQIKLLASGPDELRTFFADQMKIWGDVVRENSITAS